MKTRKPTGSASGFSLVELLIGLAVGLFVLLGASMLMVGQLSEHRRLSLETRTEQDVRALAELLIRDLRMAGSWGNAWKGLWSESNRQPMANPYGGVAIGANGSELSFWVGEAPEDDIATPRELRKFALHAGVLRRWSGGNWQPLTDPATLRIAGFRLSLHEHRHAVESICARPCDGLADCPPTSTGRELRLQLDAEAAHDAAVRRSLELRLRLQADSLQGVCPS